VLDVSNIEPAHNSGMRTRVVPTLVVFVVAAGAIYSTAWIALGLLRHLIMPIVAVIIGGYLALRTFKFTGRSRAR
jgi:hypothetical protein